MDLKATELSKSSLFANHAMPLKVSTVEFSLNMTCGRCVAAAERALTGVEGVQSFQVKDPQDLNP